MKLSLLKLLPVLLCAFLSGVGLPVDAKPKIPDDSYFHAAPGDYGLIVKGNRYHWIDVGSGKPPEWRSISELKQVKPGVVLAGNLYFCSFKALEKIRKTKPSYAMAQCTKNGWAKFR